VWVKDGGGVGVVREVDEQGEWEGLDCWREIRGGKGKWMGGGGAGDRRMGGGGGGVGGRGGGGDRRGK